LLGHADLAPELACSRMAIIAAIAEINI